MLLLSTKKRVPFTFVRYDRYDERNLGLMSLILTAALPVPLQSHSSVPPFVLKKSVPFTLIRSLGYEFLKLNSWPVTSGTVPAFVPLVRQICSLPPTPPSSARKKPTPFTLVNCVGDESNVADRRTVPAAVPSLCHNSTPIGPAV